MSSTAMPAEIRCFAMPARCCPTCRRTARNAGTSWRELPFDEIPECHQAMLENRHPYGNMAVLVNATRPGLGRS